MFMILLQVWGGLFYLLNKLFFAKTERAENFVNEQKWLIRAWIVYLIGSPPWVIIFVLERNWIAAAVEASGIPAMLIGLNGARHGQQANHSWLDHLARLLVVLSLGLSLYDFGGITSMKQLLEIGVAAGFLMGTYMLAKKNSRGYVWLMVGNITAASLLGVQKYYLLMGQQLISLCLVIDAYHIRKQK
jgi:hypothetical protein